jgi:hypothetical protein
VVERSEARRMRFEYRVGETVVRAGWC